MVPRNALAHMARSHMNVTVIGAGVVGLTCALLLAHQGITATVVSPSGAKAQLRTVLLSKSTLELLADLWQAPVADLVQGWNLERKAIAWEADTTQGMLDQRCLVVELGDAARRLSARLERLTGIRAGDTAEPDPTAWILDARGRAAATAGDASWAGRRSAIMITDARARPRSSRQSRIEALSSGWLFIAPSARRRAVIQAVLPEPLDADTAYRLLEAMLREARLADAWPDMLSRNMFVTRAAPVWREPVVGRRLSVGDAAIGFDPLSGEGVGAGVKGALLASAVLGAIARGEPATACLEHYRRRLLHAFIDHLDACLGHYARSRYPCIWRDEIRMMLDTRIRLSKQSININEYRYRINNMDLERIKVF